MRSILLVVCLEGAALWAQTLPPALPVTPASLQGTLISDSGKPQASAFVSATLSGLPPFRRAVRTASDGSFLIQGLPPGKYTVCAQIAGDGLLDPCEWGATAPTVTLAAGQNATGFALKMKTGSVLVVMIADPSAISAQKNSAGFTPHLLVGVRSPQKRFYLGHVTAKDASGLTYHVTVPLDTALTLEVQSKDLTLAQGTAGTAGPALANSAGQFSFQHNSGDPNPPGFTFTVTGKH